MFDFLNRFFKKEETTSRSARDRLQLVLIQDRAHICPELMDSLRQELVQLISRYMVIDQEAMSMALERREGAVALAASIPVINIRRTEPAEEARGVSPSMGPVVLAPPVSKVSPRAEAVETHGEKESDKDSVDSRRVRYLKRKRESLRRRRSVPGDGDVSD